jgi:hypothetical protein
MASFQGLPGFVGPNTSTGQDVGRGLTFTRIKGPGMAGQVADGAGGSNSPGPLPPAGGFICIQSTASLTNQIVTTSATGLLNASFPYIPVTTGPFNGLGAPAYTGVGAALVFNDNLGTLSIWSSSRGSWMTQVVGTSFAAGNTTFTTS